MSPKNPDLTEKPPPTGEATGRQQAKLDWAAFFGDDTFVSAKSGTFDTYRLMRGNPTIAMARMAATAPICAAEHSYELGDEASEEWRDFVEAKIEPLWQRLVKDMLFALDYGFAAFEKVWEVDGDGHLAYRKLKSLLPDKTNILVTEQHGVFAGLRQGGVTLDSSKSFLYTYDMEAGDPYGRPRHENVRGTWNRWNTLAKKQDKYITKVAGVIPIIEYPPGTSQDKTGAEKDNYDLAVAILNSLGKGVGVTMPNTLAQYATDLARQGVDLSQLRAWAIDFLETKQQHGAEMVEMMRHQESQLARGWLIPERAIIEGQHGTLAESESHAKLALVIAYLLLVEMCRYVNWYLIDPLLVVNFGMKAAGGVKIVPQSLDSAMQLFMQDLIGKVLGDKNNVDLFLDLLDVTAMLDQVGLPKNKDAGGVVAPLPEPLGDRIAQRAARRDLVRRIYQRVGLDGNDDTS